MWVASLHSARRVTCLLFGGPNPARMTRWSCSSHTFVGKTGKTSVICTLCWMRPEPTMLRRELWAKMETCWERAKLLKLDELGTKTLWLTGRGKEVQDFDWTWLMIAGLSYCCGILLNPQWEVWGLEFQEKSIWSWKSWWVTPAMRQPVSLSSRKISCSKNDAGRKKQLVKAGLGLIVLLVAFVFWTKQGASEYWDD